jgi:hypothetical protein
MSHYDELRHEAYLNETQEQDVHHYKRDWMRRKKTSPFVHIKSDLDVKAKDWCRRNISRQSWSMTTWTGVLQHTIHFENTGDANRFKDEVLNPNCKGML